MRPIRLLPTLLVALLPLTQPSLGADANPYLRVGRQDARGVSLAVRIPVPSVDVRVGADGFRRVHIEGLARDAHPGSPDLPMLVATVGVPEGARLRVSSTGTDVWASFGPPLGASVGPDSSTWQRSLSRPDSSTWERSLSRLESSTGEGARSRRTAWPEGGVVVEEVRFRGLRVARVLIYPLRYDPGSRELLLTQGLDIDIEFVGGEGFEAVGGRLAEVEDRLIDGLVNRDSVIAARVKAPPASRPRAAKALVAGDPAVKIRVDTAGLIRVTRSDLTAAGFDTAGVDPRNLELSYRGTPVPCRVTGEDDGSFDEGDSVEFYGVPGTGRFSEDNVYWLEEKIAAGHRHTTRDATPNGAPAALTFPHTEHYEEANTIYDFGEGVQEGDPHFFWAWFDANNPNVPRITKLTHVANLPGLDDTGPLATMRAFFSGQTDPVENPDHRVQFSVNGTVIGESTWNGLTFHTAEVEFDPGLLVQGQNTFEIELQSIAVVDIYYMDWFEIDYPRSPVAVSGRLAITGVGDTATRYEVDGFSSTADARVLDVTDPFAPVELTGIDTTSGPANTLRFEDVPAGRSYLVAGDAGRIGPAELTLDIPSNLRDTNTGADLLVVVPDGWEAALAPLAGRRQAQGLRVVLATLTDVADEFAGGNVDDEAIREFVRFAYENWQTPAPSYLMLVGEPNLDPLNYLQRENFDHWMPTHFGVTEALGETMSDNWFGAVAGDDLLPDVAVGRLSVRSAGEAAAVADKIIDYENQASDGAAWRSNVVRVASTSPLFEEALEDATAFLPEHFTVDTEYRLSNATTSSIQASINAGAAMVSFLGHGNVASWADSPGGSFFTTANAEALANTGRLPFVTALNCLNGLVGHPTLRDSLAEVLVNDPTQGAVAVWSPSGLGFLSEFNALQSTLYETVFQGHTSEIGTATTESLVQTFLNHPVDIDLITKMVFTGDPSGFLAVDTDDDDVLDFDEVANGLDPGDRDSDDDGLLDGAEGGAATDDDGDGVPNARDPDADNDGLLDGLEAGVVEADPDTDISRGLFFPDTHPASTTDPFDADTDNGGAPDGIEDLNANGAVDPGETDPSLFADDPVCSAATPAELATDAGNLLTLIRSDADTILNWGPAAESCVLYRVYVSSDAGGIAEAFILDTVTAQPTYTDTTLPEAGTLRLYLIVGATLEGGEGPWGHFDR